MHLGRHVSELPTPALVLDRDAIDHNVATMSSVLDGAALVRPHAKTHKCAEIAHMQIDAGAIGITVATSREALGFAQSGVRDIFLANEAVTPADIDELTRCATVARTIVAVDDPDNAAMLSQAAALAGVELGVFIDVDIGMHRCGVRGADEALALALKLAELPALELRGVTGFEGHVVLTRDDEDRKRGATEALDLLAETVDFLSNAGFDVPIVSAGGTNTISVAAHHPAVTEVQAGTYALMDTSYAPFAPAFRTALTVHSTVISRHGSQAVLNCGSKTMATTELAPPGAPDGVSVARIDEEHTLIDLHESGARWPQVGDRIELTVSYCGGTVNLHDAYWVVSEGTIVDVWPIIARGPGRIVANASSPVI